MLSFVQWFSLYQCVDRILLSIACTSNAASLFQQKTEPTELLAGCSGFEKCLNSFNYINSNAGLHIKDKGA